MYKYEKNEDTILFLAELSYKTFTDAQRRKRNHRSDIERRVKYFY